MFVKLQPEQISLMWDAIKWSVVEANKIPLHHQQKYCVDLLENLMSGNAQAWVSYTKENDSQTIKVNGIAISCFMQDVIFEQEYLLIHTAYALDTLGLEAFTEAMENLKTFAREKGCLQLKVQTPDKRLFPLYKRIGLDEDLFVYSMYL